MLSLIVTYYNNPEMLATQYSIWRDYPGDVELIVVDDASRLPAIDVPIPDGIERVKIYRILHDRPWNQDAARNIGAHVANGEWLMLMDIDHTISADNLKNVLGELTFGKSQPVAYKFFRKLKSGKKINPSPNCWLMQKNSYWSRVGGYDERLCGVYGTDRDFIQRVNRTLSVGFLMNAWLDVYLTDDISDACTQGLSREVSPLPSMDDKIVTMSCDWERVR
jgi:glycosyltransferase involved in cell wall biosynthesis